MDSRLDLPGYRKACRKLRNMVVLKQGGVTRRPGLQFIATGQQLGTGNVSRMVPFRFSPSVNYMLEFGNHGIRFYRDGAQVQVSGAPAWVSGTDYAWGSFVTYSGLTYYAYAGPVLNSTINPATDSGNWTAQTAYEVPSPYGATSVDPWEAQIFAVQVKQINDVMYMVHPDYPVWKLIRYADDNWVASEVQFLTPAMLDQNATDTTIEPSGTTGDGIDLEATAPAWATATYYVVGNSVTSGGLLYNATVAHTSSTTFSEDLALGRWKLVTLFQAGHVGSYWQIAHNRPQSFVNYDLTGDGTSDTLPLIGNWTVRTFGTWSADISVQVSYDNGSTWQVVTTLNSRDDANYDLSGEDISGGIYRMVITNWTSSTSATPPRVTLSAANQFVYGLVRITDVSDALNATADVIVPLYSTDPTTYWSEGAWSDVRGYPCAITAFQERIWYAGTAFQPQRIWATQTDDIENFAIVDQSQAVYGLAFDLNAPGRGRIQWMNAQVDLFAGLAGAEWIVTSGAPNAAITPTQIQAVEHSANGSEPGIGAQGVGNAFFYVQQLGRTFQQMLYSVFTNKYMSQEMLVLSQHLTAARLKTFAFQQQFQNQSIIWAVCGDGSMISLTYAMDQEVFGWSKHTTGETDRIISVAVIPNSSGADDEVWVTVQRKVGLSYFNTVERMNPVDWQTYATGQPDLRQATYADCYVQVTSPSTNEIPGMPAVTYGREAVASITPLNGSGMFGIGDLVVSDTGTVTITDYEPAAGDVVVIGLPIPWKVQPMRLDTDTRSISPGIKKALQKLYLRVLNSIGGKISTDNPDLPEIDIPAFPITANSGEPPPMTPNVPQDHEVDVSGLMQYEDDPIFIVQGETPLPFTLLGVTIKSDTGGSA